MGREGFKLNTQCSAEMVILANPRQRASACPRAVRPICIFRSGYPVFGYGCAYACKSDIVISTSVLRAEEFLAGWPPCCPERFPLCGQHSELTALGSRFVLQGGTQNNLGW